MRLQLDFINQSTFSISSWSLAGLAVLLTSVVMAILTWQLYEGRVLEQSAVAFKVSQMSRQIAHEKPQIQMVKSEISSEQMQQIQVTIGALIIPWGELLQGIEKSDMQDIALLSLEPNSKKQLVSIVGEAKNLQVALDYIQKLEAQPMLDKVYLQKYNIDEAHPFKPVKFTLSAQWLLSE
ncbi:hypothetical protein [Methylotenera sp.]|uniref:hypothetical protein n=1 Tax=Methylotenera sp. TaxID=2051956 RepID=UPI00248A1009|nr:hypothetical protein [Methylotenera sp.]MDI1361096.1 hypothetical protein [Methylotenera sp.]